MNDYIVLDIETTGLSKNYHKITEIGAIKVKDGLIIDEFQSLINPEVQIPIFITNLTGIDNDLVKDAPKINEVMPNFIDFIEDLPIIGHNISFDYGFLNHNYYNYFNKEIKNEILCTRRLANRLCQNLTSKKLSKLCEYYEINNEQAHRAMSDVLATHKLFEIFKQELYNKDIKTKNDFLNFQKSKIIRY